MNCHLLEPFAPLEGMPRRQQNGFVSRMSRIGFAILLYLTGSNLAAGQIAPSAPPSSPGAQACAALADLNLEDAPGGPALVTSARLVDVPTTGLERWILTPQRIW